VHRPATVFGFSPRSVRNVVASLYVYAAICRKEGDTLCWPGSLVAWEGFSNASDELWSPEARMRCSTAPTNGDVYKWKNLWPCWPAILRWSIPGTTGRISASSSRRPWPARRPCGRRSSGRRCSWRHLDDITTWWFVDALINANMEQLENMNKCKERRFLGFRNTVRSFDTSIDREDEG
jgi:hypothetical protein